MEQTASRPRQSALWRIGGTEDHPHLRTFVCADHEALGAEPWAEEVEDWLNDDFNLPGARRVQDIEFHCGYVGSVLAAVGTWRPDHEPDESYLGKHWYVLPATAVAWQFRGKGGKLADAALARVLSAVDRHALDLGATEILAVGRIHPENVGAQLLVKGNGFERYPSLDTARFEVWVRRWPGQTLDSHETRAQPPP